MILLTGATGFLGRSVLRLKPAGAVVRCLARADGLLEGADEVVRGDLKDTATLAAAVQDVDTVIHCAAVLKATDPHEFEVVNVEGTRHLIDAATAAGVARMILVSSFDATLPLLTPYSRSKREAEQVVLESKLNAVILRPTVLYGPDDKESLGTLFRIVKKFPFAPVVGNGRFELQPVHVEDVAAAIWSCVAKVPPERAYFVAGPEAVSFNGLIDAAARVLSKRVVKIHLPLALLRIPLALAGVVLRHPPVTYEDLKLASNSKTCDTRNAARDFGFAPRRLEEGLRSVYRTAS